MNLSVRVSERVWRSAVGGLIGAIVITLGLAVFIAGQDRSTRATAWSGFDGQWSITSGATDSNRLQLHSTGWALHPIDLSAFSFQVRVINPAPGAAGGLIVKARDERNFIAFLISPDGYFSVGEMRGGKWLERVAWRAWPHVRRGDQANTLRADCDRSTCVFFVNDEWTWQADHLPDGALIGLIARGGESASAARVAFDQVAAWQE